VQKAQDGDIFVRIAGMIAIISLISTIVTASFSYRNDLVSAMPDRNAHQRAGINSLSMSQQSLDDMEMPGRAQKNASIHSPTLSKISTPLAPWPASGLCDSAKFNLLRQLRQLGDHYEI